MSSALPRSHARRAAVQALYHALVNEETLVLKDTLDFVSAENSEKMDQKYFLELVQGVSENMADLDIELSHAIDRSLSAVDPVESSVLRLAVYEFKHRPDIPYRVILNEAVELAKAFGGEKGHKYVNGVLDKMGSKLRDVEYQAVKNKKNKK